jgi:hypothetical protein
MEAGMAATSHNGHLVLRSTIARDSIPASQRRFISDRILRLELANGDTVYGCSVENCDRVFEPKNSSEEAHFHAIAQVRAHLGSHTARRNAPAPRNATAVVEVGGGGGVPLDLNALIEAFSQLADVQAIQGKLQNELALADEEIGEWRQRAKYLERTLAKIAKVANEALGDD